MHYGCTYCQVTWTPRNHDDKDCWSCGYTGVRVCGPYSDTPWDPESFLAQYYAGLD